MGRDSGPVIAKIYGLTGLGIVVAAYGAHLHMTPAALPSLLTAGTHMTILQVVFMLGLALTSKAMWALRVAFFFATALAAGLNVGSWIHNALQEAGYCAGNGLSWLPDLDVFDHNVPGRGRACDTLNTLVFTALTYTIGIYACFAFSALLSPRKYGFGSTVATLVSAGLWLLFAAQVLAAFGFQRVGDFVYVRGGLVLYTFKTYVDTAEMAVKIEAGDDDVIDHALNHLYNFLHMFIRIITLLGEAKKREAEAERRKKSKE